MLLLSSLVAHPLNSFFSIQAQRRVLCSAKEAHVLPTHFLAHWARVLDFEEVVFKDKFLNLRSFAFQDRPS